MERKGGLQYVRSGANNDFHAPTSIDMVYIYIYICNTQFTFNLRLLLDFPFRKFISVSARSRRGAPFVAKSTAK